MVFSTKFLYCWAGSGIISLDSIRLGASVQNNGKPGAVKVAFSSVPDTRKILKNKSSTTAPILKNTRITDDKTPAQMPQPSERCIGTTY